VHHIIPRADNGGDDIDNAIAVCIMCHSDVHTKTLFTQRFSVDELKGHRDALYSQVESGDFPRDEHEVELFTQDILSDAARTGYNLLASVVLPTKAIEILIAASRDQHGQIIFTRVLGKCVLSIGQIHVDVEYGREEAEYVDAIKCLLQRGYAERTNTSSDSDMLCRLTHYGYIAADELESLEASGILS